MSFDRSCRLVGLLVLVLLVSSLVTAGDKVGIRWIEDYGELLEVAKKESRPIMIDFYTSWCVYCKQLDEESFGDPRVIAIVKEFACAKLDADVAKAAAMRYPAEGYPTVVFATPEGDEILRFSGYRTPDQVLAVVTRVRDIAPRVAALRARTDEDRDDYVAWAELGEIYLDIGDPEEAAHLLKRALKYAPKGKTWAATSEPAQAHVMHLLGRAQSECEDYRRACKTLEKLLKRHGESPERRAYLESLATVYDAWEKPEEAAAIRAKL